LLGGHAAGRPEGNLSRPHCPETQKIHTQRRRLDNALSPGVPGSTEEGEKDDQTRPPTPTGGWLPHLSPYQLLLNKLKLMLQFRVPLRDTPQVLNNVGVACVSNRLPHQSYGFAGSKPGSVNTGNRSTSSSKESGGINGAFSRWRPRALLVLPPRRRFDRFTGSFTVADLIITIRKMHFNNMAVLFINNREGSRPSYCDCSKGRGLLQHRSRRPSRRLSCVGGNQTKCVEGKCFGGGVHWCRCRRIRNRDRGGARSPAQKVSCLFVFP
jgi:hypothetical protein